jgi:hypothetical protein
MRVKKLLGSLGADVKVIELDESGKSFLSSPLSVLKFYLFIYL